MRESPAECGRVGNYEIVYENVDFNVSIMIKRGIQSSVQNCFDVKV